MSLSVPVPVCVCEFQLKFVSVNVSLYPWCATYLWLYVKGYLENGSSSPSSTSCGQINYINQYTCEVILYNHGAFLSSCASPLSHNLFNGHQLIH